MIARASPRPLEEIEARLDEMERDASVLDAASALAELTGIAEEALEHWIVARGDAPTTETKEGFRLLALQRQGAKGDPSFNACRESCRELAYQFNLIAADPGHSETAKRTKLAILVARHIVLFVSGKMQVAGLGEFCCSSRPVRIADGVAPVSGT